VVETTPPINPPIIGIADGSNSGDDDDDDDDDDAASDPIVAAVSVVFTASSAEASFVVSVEVSFFVIECFWRVSVFLFHLPLQSADDCMPGVVAEEICVVEISIAIEK
jgi:hypothetical protein